MQISGMPNKIEIFQSFYFSINGVEITYREALRLFYQMDADTQSEFEEFYKDEVGYEIISPSGYNFDGSSTTSKHNISVKYTLDAYAKKNGLVLDPQWAIYSAEEIMQMVDNGVNVPQDVVDIANTIMQSTASTQQEIEGEDGQETTTEKEPFLELIPKAQKNIEKCEENNDKIEKEIEDLLPEQQKRKRDIDSQMKEQRRSLKEYEGYIREWNHIQTKINNGEALSTSEAKRYAQLTGMFEDDSTQSMKENFSLDKREIARSMNEINILAILGEKLADETIEIGDTLADYTSKANYKTTRNQARGEIGFLRAIIAMSQGKTLAKEARLTGQDTKDYTEETQHSVNDIAQVLDVQGLITGKDEVLGAQQQEIQPQEPGSEEAVQEADSEEPAADGTITETNENNEVTGEQTTDPEVTEQEDFIINDENVAGLIKEAAKINVDLAKQTISAVGSIKVAKDDRKFAKIAGEKVTKLVKEFKAREEERQTKIQQLEDENKKANQELENLTGKNADELTEEENTVKKDDDESQDETDKEKVQELRQQIASNNEEIETLKIESETSKDEFQSATAKESERISESIPAEAEALKKDTKYKEEIIPADKERLDFTDASGETLSKIGVYRIELGMMQIMAWQFTKGLRNVAKGTISTGIGLGAQIISDTPIPTIAEKATDKAVRGEDNAINDLSALEAQIIEITGAEATVVEQPEEENSEGTESGENGDETTPVDGEGAPVIEKEVTEAAQIAEDAGIEAPAVEEAASDTDGTDTTEGADGTEEEVSQTPAAPTEDKNPEETDETSLETEGAEGSQETTTTGGSENDNDEKTPEEQAAAAKEQKAQIKKETDRQEDIVKEGNKTAKDDAKESKKIKKDEDKDAKQLEKEAKKLEQQIKQEQEEVITLTKESEKAVEKQNEILAEYETLNAESEQMMAEEEAKQLSKPKDQPQQNDDNEAGGLLASNSFTVTNSADSVGGGNKSKLQQNSQRINELGVEFKSQDTIVVRNRGKILNLQDSISTKYKKFEKKLKIKDKKIKETEKKEKDKQKRLNKTLGAIGIAENVFSITMTTGQVIMMVGSTIQETGAGMVVTGLGLLCWPTTPIGMALINEGHVVIVNGEAVTGVGSVVNTIGLIGVAACGVAKATVNIANGNLAAGLISLGTTAVTVATSVAGGGAAAGSALQYVSAGLSVVSSSAELVNNVRAVQGKEASGLFSKIGTIAGVGSALTGAASSLGNMGSQNGLGKMLTIASATGTVLSSTSQLMSEFGAEGNAANILGMIGGGLQTVSSISQLATNTTKQESDDNSDNNNGSEGDTKKSDKAIDKLSKDGDGNDITPEMKNKAKEVVAKVQQEGLSMTSSEVDATLKSFGFSDKQIGLVKNTMKKMGIQTKVIPENKTPTGVRNGIVTSTIVKNATGEIDNSLNPNLDYSLTAGQQSNGIVSGTTYGATSTDDTSDTSNEPDNTKEKKDTKPNSDDPNKTGAQQQSATIDTSTESNITTAPNSTNKAKVDANGEVVGRTDVEQAQAQELIKQAEQDQFAPATEDTTDSTSTNDDDSNLSERDKKIKEADDARQKQEELAKDPKYTEAEIKNIVESGASDEFAHLDDKALQEKIDAIPDKDSAEYKKLKAEQDKRQKYQKQQKDAKRLKTAKKYEKRDKIIDTVSQTASTAMQVAAMFMTSSQEGEIKKKMAVPGQLTKRTKEIMKKNQEYRQRRVNALAKTRKYYA